MTKMRETVAAAAIAAFLLSAAPSWAQGQPSAEEMPGSDNSLSGFLSVVDQLTDDAPNAGQLSGFDQSQGAGLLSLGVAPPPIMVLVSDGDADRDGQVLAENAHGPLPGSASVSEASGSAEGGSAPEGGLHNGPPGMHRGWGGGGGCHSHCILTGDLALTDDQYQRLYDLKQSFLDSVGPKMLQKKTLERHLKTEMIAVDIDAKKVHDLENQLIAVKGELANQKIDHLIAASQVLTKDQRTAIHKAIVKRSVERGMHGFMGGHKHGEHHHHHFGHGH